MGYIRTEEEVDAMIAEMVSKTRGKYITQGVTFNKDSKRHLELLKMVLMRATSFSGFIKEILAEIEMKEKSELQHMVSLSTFMVEQQSQVKEDPIDVGNFL